LLTVQLSENIIDHRLNTFNYTNSYLSTSTTSVFYIS